MKKAFLIGWKDVKLSFRDRAALILMLAAPFVLTLGLGLIAGRFSGSGGGLSEIPVAVVNQDGGELGNALVSAFESEELSTLLTLTVLDDPAAAREEVDQDHVAAAVVIPQGFTGSIIPAEGVSAPGPAVAITIYTNPTRPTGVGVVKTIVDGFVSRLEVARASSTVAVRQLLGEGLIAPQDAQRIGAEIGWRQGDAAQAGATLTLRSVTAAGEQVEFDVLAYMAPGMALLFLMFTVSNGGRTLLAERAQGTLPRLLVSPTPTWQVLAGKVLGIYMTGAAQMLILILGSTLLFGLDWGDPVAVVVLVLAAVVGAVGWGMLITALARTPGQVNALGSAIMLIFGILGGSFVSLSNMPAWFSAISRITPNAWGLDGFNTLAQGGGLTNILKPLGALVVMGVGLFTVAAFLLNRRGIAQA
jgi:ABC-2 type transport system permease protein